MRGSLQNYLHLLMWTRLSVYVFLWGWLFTHKILQLQISVDSYQDHRLTASDHFWNWYNCELPHFIRLERILHDTRWFSHDFFMCQCDFFICQMVTTMKNSQFCYFIAYFYFSMMDWNLTKNLTGLIIFICLLQNHLVSELSLFGVMIFCT